MFLLLSKSHNYHYKSFEIVSLNNFMWEYLFKELNFTLAKTFWYSVYKAKILAGTLEGLAIALLLLLCLRKVSLSKVLTGLVREVGFKKGLYSSSTSSSSYWLVGILLKSILVGLSSLALLFL